MGRIVKAWTAATTPGREPKLVVKLCPSAGLSAGLSGKIRGWNLSMTSQMNDDDDGAGGGVYTGLDIVTAKATKEEQRQAVHHLLDVARPDQAFTVTHFRERALPIQL
uniref:Uncharacterized protein n=1 Tax=Anopheles coluzzii TaxID=1518534 RepID=A0A8W7PRD4_ANOCL